MVFITNLGSTQTIIIAVILSLIILSIFKKWSYIKSLLIFVLGGELFVWTIKNLIERPRPPITNALVIENSYSFPSGHSFMAIAFYGLLTFFIFDNLQKRSLKIISLIIGTTLIILISFSRIYLNVHWPSDVLASFLFGSIWLLIIVRINKKIK